MLYLLLAPWVAFAEPRPTDFLPAAQLDKDIKAYCAKAGPGETHVHASSDKVVNGLRFQFVRFGQALNECRGERELLQLVDGSTKHLLYDSGLRSETGCGETMHFTHVPDVHEFAESSADPEAARRRRKLAVVETFNVTPACAGVEDARTRRFQIFDLGAQPRLLLDFEADTVAFEDSRLNIVGASKVRGGEAKVPVAIQLEGGTFAIHLSPNPRPTRSTSAVPSGRR